MNMRVDEEMVAEELAVEDAPADDLIVVEATATEVAAVAKELDESISADKPIALIQGKPFINLPHDLYIPPDALKVFLEAFEGPLDLLLYLIRRQNLDILDIPIANITEQYMEYVNIMQSFEFELAAEYLVMAAMLAEIKSRLLLPRSGEETEEENDPRAELVRRLQEYERYKKAAEDIDELPRRERDIFIGNVLAPALEISEAQPDVKMDELLKAFQRVMLRAKVNKHHHIEREVMSIRERMTIVLEQLRGVQFRRFIELFSPEEGRLGVVVTFMAILELVRQSMIEVIQAEAYSPIHVKAVE